jgi:tetratricopeptide (TPR) repeat protein
MWWDTQFAFAGIPDPAHADLKVDKSYDDRQWIFSGDTSKVSGKIKSIPDLPTTIMDEADATLKVVDAKETLNQTAKLDLKDRERWNDYGIGLLLQGDLKGAEAAFMKVTEVEPKYADGWVNIGRARIQEGDIAGAQTVLKKALELNPELAKTHFFYAMTLKSQGRYSEALEHLKKTIDQYPRDRVVRNQIGRILFLQRKFNEAVAEFKQTLLVDPEDLQAHYNLMLCYQGLKKQDLADREQILYLRFKAEEAAQTITGPYRKLHPEDNNERQPIHEHTSIPLDQKAP